MYEATQFETEKLTACIYAALRFPNDRSSLAAAWDENGNIVAALIWDSFCKYETAVIERTLQLQPDQIEQLKRELERQRVWRRAQWECRIVER